MAPHRGDKLRRSQRNRAIENVFIEAQRAISLEQRGQTAAQFLGYNERNFGAYLGYQMVDSNYTAEAGFVPRIGFQTFIPGLRRTFYPKSKNLNTWTIGLDGSMTYSLDFKETDRDLSVYAAAELKDQTSFNLTVWNS